MAIKLFNHMHPWIMLALCCGIFYLMVGYMEPLYPREYKWTFYIPLFMVGVSTVGIVWMCFRARAIFDRMDARAKEHERY